MSQIDVVIGTTAVRRSSFALDHFLRNLYDIQRAYSSSELVVATDESDFVGELTHLLREYKLHGRIILYETETPNHEENYRLWSITFGREAIRKYVLEHRAHYLLFLDSDMTYDPQTINIMLDIIRKGYDAVQSGYMMRSKNLNALGFGGCTLIKRDVLKGVTFRCTEFETGYVIDEFNLFEMDLVRMGARIKKGIFITINHYLNHDEMISISPKDLNIFQKITTYPLFRYVLLQLSIISKYDVTRYLQRIVYARRR
jgi:hypothetical protein